MVVVENEHGGHFDDSACVSALQQLRQQQRRVLCNGQSIENWKNTALRLQYAEFLVWEAPALDDSNVRKSHQHRTECWPKQGLQVERSSVAAVMEAYGKSSSVHRALWKASSQKDVTPRHLNALLLAMSCLSLRRVRSEVEPELRKIEEISLGCQLSQSQSMQYRNELAGFTATLDSASGREQRLSVWLQLLLRLRQICNCVDLATDMEKLGHADLRLLTSCSAKLEALEPLLRRLALQEGKKVVIYCQFHGMFPVLELFLSLLDISYVRITGSISMQRRALYHFADRPVVRVALASTRLSTSYGGHAVSVYGSEAIVVVDGDWNATCDAKLRASWAKLAACGADTLPVYRLHCENTVEASLLRVGASLTEKVFGKMSPLELLAVPSDMASMIEKPSWWSLTSSSLNGLTAGGLTVDLASVADEVERNEKYCGGPNELEVPLIVHNVDLHAEEHLLLANTDELTPVEWYAVDYVHGITDKKQQRSDERRAERVVASIEDESSHSWNESGTLLQSNQRSFDNLAVLQAKRLWQEGDAAAQLFYSVKTRNGTVDKSALEELFMQMRMQGMETCFDVYEPPRVPRLGTARLQPVVLFSTAASSIDTRMTFRISYRVPAPLPPVPHVGKSKFDHIVGQLGDASRLTKLSKKQRVSLAAVAGSRASVHGSVPGSSLTNLPSNSAGVKRKLETQLTGIKSGLQKERRVDLEGIPVPDVSEFADDDFWGDTNLDALDSAEWDDPALYSGILGASVGALEPAVSSTVSSSGTASSGAGASTASTSSGIVGSGTGAHVESGFKTGFQKSSKKAKMGTGRARKSSMSLPDSGRDAWTGQDDTILKKLFELYGANWTLIAQVFNSTTAVSRFVCKKRSPRQCYDRYGKIISCGLAAVSSGASASAMVAITTESKPGVSVKVQRATSVAAAVLDTRIGLTRNELLVKFPQRYSLPGIPPPSIASAPSRKGLTLAYRQRQVVADADAGTKAIYTNAGALEDLGSIRASFDAIIQCVKRKTSPPPIPIPVEASSATPGPTAAPPAASSTDLGTKASLTAASFPSSHVSTSSSAPSTPTKASAKVFRKASVSPVTATKSNRVVVPPPHKSYTDMVSLLPGAVLSPDEVIKRSKEAAVVAVQAAAVVASTGRDGSPLSASGDVMLGAGSGFGVSVSTSMPRRLHAASLTSEANAVGVMSTSTMPSTGAASVGAAVTTAPAGTQAQTITAATTAAWGGVVHGVGANEANAGLAVDIATASREAQRNAPMPVTTSTLLHVLDRMPEVKNKIQLILNRTDCSESQKVAMIARLLSNTNAINNTNALGASGPMPLPDVSSASSSAVLSALTADLSSSNRSIGTKTPIPMPASLDQMSPTLNTSSTRAPPGQIQQPPPAK
uniref:Myb-like domain-containing protein n=1 Tax=Peronospora matthiolae TaxID=2874970 RepID=A0AAV1T8X0_9STRA